MEDEICNDSSEGFSRELTPRQMLSRPSWDSVGVILKYIKRLALTLEIRPTWRTNYLCLHPLLRMACTGIRILQRFYQELC